MTEPPSTSELSRRIDELTRLVRDLPTEKTLVALLAARDAEIAALRDDVRDLTKALAEERAARVSGDKEIVSESASAKRWAVGVAISGAVAVIGFVGFLMQIAGGGAA